MQKQKLKQEVHAYWDQASCGTEVTHHEKYTYTYFEEIEAYRYAVEPEIFSFAQFTRFRGKKVLEVGVGAGTDFLQWVRAGADAYGIDLTPEAVENVRQRLTLYGVHAKEVRVADAEKLPYTDDSFECVYSWGVIHHSPDTHKCLQEIIRVTKPGGIAKIMIYHRRSLFAFYRYLLCGLFKGKPFKSWSSILFHHQESLGTKAYTFAEVRALLTDEPVTIKSISAPVTKHDLLFYKAWPFRALAYCAASLFGWQRRGFFMMIELEKENDANT